MNFNIKSVIDDQIKSSIETKQKLGNSKAGVSNVRVC